MQLLSLAVLLSSTFVFNQMGPIDEAALDRLSLVTQITKHVRVRATGPATGEQSHAAGAAAAGVPRVISRSIQGVYEAAAGAAAGPEQPSSRCSSLSQASAICSYH